MLAVESGLVARGGRGRRGARRDPGLELLELDLDLRLDRRRGKGDRPLRREVAEIGLLCRPRVSSEALEVRVSGWVGLRDDLPCADCRLGIADLLIRVRDQLGERPV